MLTLRALISLNRIITNSYCILVTIISVVWYTTCSSTGPLHVNLSKWKTKHTHDSCMLLISATVVNFAELLKSFKHTIFMLKILEELAILEPTQVRVHLLEHFKHQRAGLHLKSIRQTNIMDTIHFHNNPVRLNS